MTIHHATIKNAATSAIVLTSEDIDGVPHAKAYWLEASRVITMPEKYAKEAVAAMRLVQLLHDEYPALDLVQEEGKFIATGSIRDEETSEVVHHVVYEGKGVPELADLLDAATEKGVDPEQGYTETVRGEVVPQKYKDMYAERGNRDHCGDWLAKELEGVFTGEGGTFDADAFTAFLKENGVDFTGKWASLPTSGQKGWVGRYRMNGRQKLERVMAETGKLTIGGDDVAVPVAYLNALLDKHPKVEAKWKLDDAA